MCAMDGRMPYQGSEAGLVQPQAISGGCAVPRRGGELLSERLEECRPWGCPLQRTPQLISAAQNAPIDIQHRILQEAATRTQPEEYCVVNEG